MPRIAPGSRWCSSRGACRKAYVLRDDSDERLPGGDATILRIAHTYVVLRTGLTLDEINANPRIQLVPP